MATLGALLYLLAGSAPKLPIAAANGSFVNADVGTLVLKDGRMTVGRRYANYVLETDKVGAYVLPNAYVAVSERGFVVDQQGYPLKLRLDDPARPRRVDLMNETRNTLVSFERVEGN